MKSSSRSRHALRLGVVAILLAGCGESPTVPPAAHNASEASRSYVQGTETLDQLQTPIAHIIIIFQENRTPDYLFQGLRGADISKTGIDSKGEVVPLHRVSLKAGYDLLHGHDAFVVDYDNGKLDGFDKALPWAKHLEPFGYAPMSQVRPYHDMATQYVFADHMFQSNQGPSFPAHQYIISGRATDASLKPYEVSGNPRGAMPRGRGAGCDGPPASNVTTIDPHNGLAGPSPFPCFDPLVLSDLLDSKSVSWRYYQDSAGAGVWHAYDAVRHVRYGLDYANVRWPSTAVLTDLSNGDLAAVTWVMPARPWSDHAGRGSTTMGPAWVAAIVNAIGESQFWNSSAIFVTWDDWGGWYDH
ncbi:MAG: hypothetical protein JO003_06580, partial [Candidatus Eremiobacteraeota bacterium]|nr:hypothetical protein [Candidatus Eremiobacteraeota bacterium]